MHGQDTTRGRYAAIAADGYRDATTAAEYHATRNAVDQLAAYGFLTETEAALLELARRMTANRLRVGASEQRSIPATVKTLKNRIRHAYDRRGLERVEMALTEALRDGSINPDGQAVTDIQRALDAKRAEVAPHTAAAGELPRLDKAQRLLGRLDPMTAAWPAA